LQINLKIQNSRSVGNVVTNVYAKSNERMHIDKALVITTRTRRRTFIAIRDLLLPSGSNNWCILLQRGPIKTAHFWNTIFLQPLQT